MKTDFKTITMICILGVLYLIPIVSAQQVQKYIVIDQFGYRPSDTKVAVIADPQVGFNSTDFFIPGNVYQVRRKSDNTIQYQGSPVQWNSGSTHFQSGDRGWWFEFTPVRDTGEFYVYDTVNKVRSYYFKIAPDIYKDILKAACKMYYYQRLNIAHPTQYAGTIWADGFSLAADTAAGDIQDQTNPAKIKDMSKGWMDAGDINKYVTYAVSPVHQLLTAYSLNSEVFTDDFNIPESGNGIPDILDEVKWELDWVMHMQDTTDGGTYIKVSHNNSASYISPLSLDTQPRFYFTPKSSAATIDAASMLAHAAL
ncbi:MAG: glycoside hydrolase family 9 protein, partial [bacterium]